MLARGGRTVLTVAFTGEVCNHVRLRRELTALGHRFTTRSDSEVVLHAIDAWGERAPSRMEGMFAYVSAGTPETEGPVPVAATRTVLARVGPGLADVGTVAGNGPFAAQILAYCAQLGLDPERMNPHSGSIALREPYGGPAPGSPAPL